MTPHIQLFRHDPANGVMGDCYRTCVACLLDLQPEDVPHVVQSMDDGEACTARMNEWLAGRGLKFIPMGWPSDQMAMEDALLVASAFSPGTAFLFSGTSPRGTDHVTIARDGEIVHDPHPDGGNLVGPMGDGWWHIEFLGARV